MEEIPHNSFRIFNSGLCDLSHAEITGYSIYGIYIYYNVA